MKEKTIKVIVVICLALIFTVRPLSAFADEDSDYGISAEEYLRHIDEDFPERTYTSETKDNMREWMTDEIRSFGYEPNIISFTQRSFIDWQEYTGYNIEFTKSGESEKTIVVCAHYDCVDTHGCEDNGTGVSVLLELAKRFADINTKYTIRFVLFDLEEQMMTGSMNYVENQDISDVILCLNIDSVGVGDNLFVYGGSYKYSDTGEQTLEYDWGLNQILVCAEATKVDARTIPMDYKGENVTPPTIGGSDHMAFVQKNIPYVVISTGCWTNEEAEQDRQTWDSEIPDGVIMHVPEYDNLDFIESHFGNRTFVHMSQASKLLTYMLTYADPDLAPEEIAGSIKDVEKESASETTIANESVEDSSTTEVQSQKQESIVEQQTQTEFVTETETENDNVAKTLPETPESQTNENPTRQTNDSNGSPNFILLIAIIICSIFVVYGIFITVRKISKSKNKKNH